jgi:hypothetical protein
MLVIANIILIGRVITKATIIDTKNKFNSNMIVIGKGNIQNIAYIGIRVFT